ncbi:hypothetical protein [Ancylobacter amanitiformis]|uniref:DUF3077 domain-containing protein n=1 Tax=Ancylobacter amanitiformis TaxID=217069 RepID=A0ABU0LS70_9HYPH|nr:hypothetical protein [Ancylobacter amanitiformis]MDQ0511514.1 hypothetical protein [Ancylobacter amanitiformis]
MAQSERPSLSVLDETAALIGGETACGQTVDMRVPLLGTDSELHHQIADALTAIMLQAEAMRRNSIHSRVNEAAITSSCHHIVECAKRAWQLIGEPPGSADTRR